MQVLVRRRAFTLIELLVVLVILAIMAAVLFPVVGRPRHGKQNSQRASCQSNMKQMGLALIQYTQDYDERWMAIAPNAVGSSVAPFAEPYGWADALQPYARSTQILQCPSEANRTEGVDAVRTGFTDYWMNLNMSRAQTKYLNNPALTFLCGDGNDGRDGTDARYARNVIPQFWLDEENSPARRHLEVMNILFADGHVKAIKAEKITTGPPSGNSTRPYTFRP